MFLAPQKCKIHEVISFCGCVRVAWSHTSFLSFQIKTIRHDFNTVLNTYWLDLNHDFLNSSFEHVGTCIVRTGSNEYTQSMFCLSLVGRIP